MIREYGLWILIYFAVMSVVAIGLTVYNKSAAVHHRRRIRERTLLLTAALSGCVAMYVTMLLIRHKTRKNKFMVGIPVIFIIEDLIVLALWFAGIIRW